MMFRTEAMMKRITISFSEEDSQVDLSDDSNSNEGDADSEIVEYQGIMLALHYDFWQYY